MILVCINNDWLEGSVYHKKVDKVLLTLNKKYTILNESKYWNEVGVEIENDKGIINFYNIIRFKPLSDTRNEKIDKLLEN